jgi:histidine triad (HIT) family protein
MSHKDEKDRACPFCDHLAGVSACAFIRRTHEVAAFVNLRQYERGALLVIPVRHAATVLDLDPSLVGAVHAEAALVGRAVMRAFGASGLNIFQNNGPDAGQHVHHLHVHVVPRYPGSDPTLIYQQAHFEPVPFAEQLAVAERIREALDAL